MKFLSAVVGLVVLGTLQLCIVPCAADTANPIQKVLQLLVDMEQQIIHEGEERHKGFTEFSNMCDHRSTELSHEIKTAKSQVEDLKATIDKATDDEGETTTEIEELSAILSNGEADLKAATKIRKEETTNFMVDQKDLIDTISQMERAISMVEKQQKGGASFAQLPVSVQKGSLAVQQQRAAALAEAFSAMIDSSSLDSADTERLASLVQTSEGDASEDGTDADAAEMDAAEESFSAGTRGPAQNAGNIVETLENMLDKAQGQLETARTTETKSRFNFELLKASLERKVAQAQKEMQETKKAKSEAGQSRATAEGHIEVTKKDLSEDIVSLNALHHECMSKASDFEEETKSRAEELKALATAKKTITEMTGGAEKDTYEKDSFAQVSFLQARSTRSVPATVQALRAVRELGKKEKLPALLEVAHKMESIVRSSAISGKDPFAKVKNMISSMLNNLVRQMEDEANHKAYCDKEMTDTKKSKASKESAVDKLTTRIDTQSSESLNLREQVAILQKELLSIMQTQREMDQIRSEDHAFWQKTKPQIQMGLEGIKKALQVMRQYYSQDDEKDHEAKGGAGSTIIGMLEVIESDFAKSVANLDEQEETSKAQYEHQTKENNIAKAVKTQDVVFKTKEIKSISKSTSESSSDLDGVQTGLDAINEYYAKIQEECVAKPDSYEERRKRHDTTLQGLQDAMQTLKGGAALAQKNARQ